MTLRTDYTLKEDAEDNLKSSLNVAPFSFSVTLYPHADVGRGQGARVAHRLGALPSAHSQPTAVRGESPSQGSPEPPDRPRGLPSSLLA